MMKKKYIPDFLFSRAIDVPASFYLDHKIKAVFSDLDNTLAAYHEPLPSQEVKDYVAALKEQGIDFYIASNNHGKRVNEYSKALGVECASMLFKPFALFFKRFIKSRGLSPIQCAMVGDQTVTDVAAGNKAGCLTILVEHLSEEKPIWTKINSSRDDRYRKKIMADKLSVDLRSGGKK